MAAPGTLWLLSSCSSCPATAMLAVAFGGVDPIFRNAEPVWNPVDWDFEAMHVLDRVFTGELAHVFVRTGLVRLLALIGCFVIGYPVAYYVARVAGRTRRPARPARGSVLDQLPDADAGVGQPAADRRTRQPRRGFARLRSRNWLDGDGPTVIPAWSTATCRSSSCRSTPPSSGSTSAARGIARPGASACCDLREGHAAAVGPGLMAASVIVVLPMMGDYYTNTYSHRRSPRTEMIGNQIEFYLSAAPEGGRRSLVLILMGVADGVHVRTTCVTDARSQREEFEVASAGDPWRRW